MSRYGQTGRKDIATDARRLRPLLAALGGVDTYKVKVSADDTTPDYLEQKFSSIDTSVEITVKNAGANEVVDFSVATYVADEIATHTGDADAHHNQVHVLATTAGLGADHTVSGLTAGQVLRASGATTAAFAVLQHDDLGGVGADDHHSQSHVLASTSGLGADHTVVGLTPGQVLRATGATTAAFASLQATDLPAHVLATNLALGSQHTISGATAGHVLRATGATTAAFASIQATDLPTGATLSVSSSNSGNSHAITSSSAVSTATAVLLATDSNGRTQVRGFGVGATAGANDAITLPDNGWVGLGASAGRVEFDNQTVDEVNILDAYVGINTSTPTARVFIDASTDSVPGLVISAGSNGEIAAPDGSSFRLGLWNSGTTTFTEKVQINSAGETVYGAQTIDQGADDGSATLWVSSDVAHGMTSLVPTDVYGRTLKISGTAGGLQIIGYSETTIGTIVSGTITTEDTTKANSSTAHVVTVSGTKSGTSQAAPGANSNIFAVRHFGATRFLVDAEGDIHMDATSNINAWDDKDDLAMINGLRGSLVPQLRERYGELVRQMRPVLEAGNIATFNDGPNGDGSIFLNVSNALLLTMDGLRQVHERLDGRLQRIEQRLLIDA